MKENNVFRILMISILSLSLSSCSSVDCSKSKDSYESGYSSGKLAKLTGGYGSCSDFVDSYNYQTGRNTLTATDCFCEGYDDGLNGNPEKYK